MSRNHRFIWSITWRYLIGFTGAGILLAIAQPLLEITEGLSAVYVLYALSAMILTVATWFALSHALCNDYRKFTVRIDGGKMTIKHFLIFFVVNVLIGCSVTGLAKLLNIYLAAGITALFSLATGIFGTYLSFKIFLWMFRKTVHIEENLHENTEA